MPQSHGCARLGAVPWRAEVALDDGAEPHANRDAFPARVLRVPRESAVAEMVSHEASGPP